MRMCENGVFFLKSLSAIFSCYLVTGSTEAPRRWLDIGGSPGSEHWSAVCWCRKYQDIYKYPASDLLSKWKCVYSWYLLKPFWSELDNTSKMKDVSNSISQPREILFWFLSLLNTSFWKSDVLLWMLWWAARLGGRVCSFEIRWWAAKNLHSECKTSPNIIREGLANRMRKQNTFRARKYKTVN